VEQAHAGINARLDSWCAIVPPVPPAPAHPRHRISWPGLAKAGGSSTPTRIKDHFIRDGLERGIYDDLLGRVLTHPPTTGGTRREGRCRDMRHERRERICCPLQCLFGVSLGGDDIAVCERLRARRKHPPVYPVTPDLFPVQKSSERSRYVDVAKFQDKILSNYTNLKFGAVQANSCDLLTSDTVRDPIRELVSPRRTPDLSKDGICYPGNSP
jgi:hypothetical protein